MPFDISVRAEIKAITKSLSALAYKQMPYAQARALTAIAKNVKVAEKKELLATFPTATPFTQNGIGSTTARKGVDVATVYMRDITANYIRPYIKGGVHYLGAKKCLLTPIAQAKNQYGNLPRSTLARLKAKKNVFIGAVTYKASGKTINGVWQRPINKRGQAGPLVLLIKFSAPEPVKEHFDWYGVAQSTVAKTFKREMGAALARAVASAR